MKGSTKQPKVFISYSWSSPQHEQWVLGLAERLSGDAVVVVLDKWDLKEGQDKQNLLLYNQCFSKNQQNPNCSN